MTLQPNAETLSILTIDGQYSLVSLFGVEVHCYYMVAQKGNSSCGSCILQVMLQVSVELQVMVRSESVTLLDHEPNRSKERPQTISLVSL